MWFLHLTILPLDSPAPANMCPHIKTNQKQRLNVAGIIDIDIEMDIDR